MVSVGTFLSIGIIAGVGILGYAVYRNFGQIGGALSRGVTQNITNPFGDYFENLFASSNGNGNGTGNGTGNGVTIPDPSKPAFGLLPEAQAPRPGQAATLSEKQATYYEEKYGPPAQEAAKKILKIFAPSSQDILIKKADVLSAGSQTPITSQAYSIIDLIRESVGGKDPKTNIFATLKTLGGEQYGGEKYKTLPLSKEAISFYATKGIIAHEVYL